MNRVEKEAVLHCLKSMIDEELCEECPLYGTTGTDHCEKDCVRLAINALEQAPCDDAISRKAVLDEMYKRKADGDAITAGFIKNLQAVTPQPKTGHWIIIDDCEQFIAKCSECGRIEDSRMVNKYPYCHCGTKMQEVEE